MQETLLHKHHVLQCPSCGAIRTGSGKTGKCFKCGHTWQLIDKQQGGTRGVLYSAWRPTEAIEFCKQEKQRRK